MRQVAALGFQLSSNNHLNNVKRRKATNTAGIGFPLSSHCQQIGLTNTVPPTTIVALVKTLSSRRGGLNCLCKKKATILSDNRTSYPLLSSPCWSCANAILIAVMATF
ncbi:hypothetical protein CA13_37390 [Planctomycetes bacterium CA13]|uniref:Uncharacterized protein n=1 Tax=Novipirellula herctigrandis TaxID=2527986 RepID=A0A5C5Z5E8_9BACT|nr:hypothetical protein CA13_37390 [Planctomycetes bacterium CA13]